MNKSNAFWHITMRVVSEPQLKFGKIQWFGFGFSTLNKQISPTSARSVWSQSVTSGLVQSSWYLHVTFWILDLFKDKLFGFWFGLGFWFGFGCGFGLGFWFGFGFWVGFRFGFCIGLGTLPQALSSLTNPINNTIIKQLEVVFCFKKINWHYYNYNLHWILLKSLRHYLPNIWFIWSPCSHYRRRWPRRGWRRSAWVLQACLHQKYPKKYYDIVITQKSSQIAQTTRFCITSKLL